MVAVVVGVAVGVVVAVAVVVVVGVAVVMSDKSNEDRAREHIERFMGEQTGFGRRVDLSGYAEVHFAKDTLVEMVAQALAEAERRGYVKGLRWAQNVVESHIELYRQQHSTVEAIALVPVKRDIQAEAERGENE